VCLRTWPKRGETRSTLPLIFDRALTSEDSTEVDHGYTVASPTGTSASFANRPPDGEGPELKNPTDTQSHDSGEIGPSPQVGSELILVEVPVRDVDSLRRNTSSGVTRTDPAALHLATERLETLKLRFGRLERVALKIESGEPSTDSEHLLAFGIVLAVQAAEDAARCLLVLDGSSDSVADDQLFHRLALYGLMRDEHAELLAPLQALRTDLVRKYDTIDIRRLVPQLGPRLHALMAFSNAMAGILSAFRT